MKKTLLALAFVGATLLSAADISVTASNPTASATFSVSVDLSTGGQAVSGVAFDLLFNPTLVAFTGTSTFGDPLLTPNNQLALTTSGVGGVSLSAPGDVNAYYVSFDSPGVLAAQQVASFQLLSLNFVVISAPGTSALTLSNLSILDANANDITSNFAVNNGSVRLVNTPEPMPGLLMLAALPAILLLLRSKQLRRA